jgi:hypothetical protein
MKNIVKISKIQAKPFIEKTFPEYSGRKFFVEFEETVFFWDTNWGGGTRNVFKAMSFDGKVFGMNVPAPWKNMVEGTSLHLNENVVVVEHSIFCGCDMGIRIHAHPSLSPKLLAGGK